MQTEVQAFQAPDGNTERIVDGNHVLGTPEKQEMNKVHSLQEFAEIFFTFC